MEKENKSLDIKSIESRVALAREAINGPLPEMGVTKREAVWKKNKATLWYYPPAEKKYRIPVFIVYSLINKPVILDLSPESSMIASFVNEGFQVYLLDFGAPGFEDGDLSISGYVSDYIQKGVKKALRHSRAKEITVYGVCLGGTLAAMYAAIAEEPVKNLILSTPPIDFSHSPAFDEWSKAIREGNADFDEWLDVTQTLPGFVVNRGLNLVTSPIHFSSYLALLSRVEDPKYVDKWRRFNHWTRDHVPFTGAAMKQMMNDLVRKNKLVTGEIKINKKKASLKNIQANLLVIAAENDFLVPEKMIKPIMKLVSSRDKTYKLIKGGHTSFSNASMFPPYIAEWLPERSEPRS
ncbi:polyhydroxyalkanoate synthase [Peribacillus deserti]|uniref:Polyhydroxyalkanoate synthase n=1 Tax=Peribacillus deserti TaxID=673318 RepID=A0ABS2QFU2_9BACI|nr:alpha/beta fold hydrolase [Peribacillus deserti]MBM7692019.1 polyhydroxyalkanoate synthase [Peribacillus deserti]